MINLNTGKQLSASVKLQNSLPPPRLFENNLVIFNTEMRKLTKTKGGHSSLSEISGPPKEQNFTVKDLGPLRRPQCQKSMQVGI